MPGTNNQPKISIYEKHSPAGQSFADQLRSFSDDNRVNLLKESFDEYLQGYKKELIFAYDFENAPEIIANAAMLERFKVETMEVLSSESQTSAQKQKIINVLFGKESEYNKLYNSYYAENGLVKRAQEHFGDLEKTIKPLFKDVISDGFRSEDLTLDNVETVFKNLSALKSSMHLDSHTRKQSFVLATTKLDGENFQASLMGIIMSDPKQLGTLFALMGNKAKNGQIDIVQDKSWHIGKKTIKGLAHAGLRCLFIAVVLGTFLASGAILAGPLAAAIGIPLLTTKVVSAIVTTTVGGFLGFAAIGYINNKVITEKRYTEENYQNASVQSNVSGIGISSDNVSKYIIAPIYKGRQEDIKVSLKDDFEKKFNDIKSNVFRNKDVINNTVADQLRNKIDAITKKMKESKIFGVNMLNDNSKKSRTI